MYYYNFRLQLLFTALPTFYQKMLAKASIAPLRASRFAPFTPLKSTVTRTQTVTKASHQEIVPENVRNNIALTTLSGAALGMMALASAVPEAQAAVPVADVAGLDVSTAKLIENILRPTFSIFTLLYIVRIPMTWYPSIDGKQFPWTIAYTPTEPILSATRKVIPLVGGVDITPIVWVGLLSFFSEILLGPQGLLILVQRQGGL